MSYLLFIKKKSDGNTNNVIQNKLKLYVPIKESTCNKGRNSEKENDIKTMKAIGMSKKNIKSLFFKHNFLLNTIGGIIGIALSIIIIYAQLNFSFLKIPGLEIGYPVAIKFMNIVFVIITVVITGFCSAYISSLILKKN